VRVPPVERLGSAPHDARTVADVLRGDNWGHDAWTEYSGERRVRVLSRFVTEQRATFKPSAVERRRAIFAVAATGEPLTSLSLTRLLGPDIVATEAFEEANLARVLDVALTGPYPGWPMGYGDPASWRAG
jgi:hypothetical protein